MSITFDGIEWDYNNLSGIGYNSDKMLEPYATWFYLITQATNYEKDIIDLTIYDDNFEKTINKRKDSILKINDYSKRFINRTHTDSLTLTDIPCINATKKTVESINVNDESKRSFIRKNKDDMIYSLDECRYITEDSQGVVIIVDQDEVSGGTSLFDFELKDSTWSQVDFDNWCESDCPVNYNDVRPFFPGEYEYTDAYVGFKLKAPLGEGKFGVVNSTVYIDVEDTVEKGTTDAVSGDLTRVNFSKTFYTTPRIITSLNFSQENCFIEVRNITRDYFEFGLKSIDDGSYVAGQINWLVDGY